MKPKYDIEVVNLFVDEIEYMVQKMYRNEKIYLFTMNHKPISFDGRMGEEIVSNNMELK